LLDILRGISIIGIALINVQFFIMSISRLATWQWSQVSISEGLTRDGLSFFVERQFLSIFTILFGMGLALQYQRARQANQSFTGVAVRRLLALLALGVTHGVLLWYGDILALYALLGFIVLAFRNRSPRTRLVCGLIIFMVPVLLQAFLALPDPHARAKSLEEMKESIVVELQKQAKAPSSRVPTSKTASDKSPPPSTSPDTQNAKQKAAAMQTMVRLVNFLGDDEKCYRSGTWGQMVLHRSFYFLIFSPLVGLTDLTWRGLGLMLIGMYMFQRGYFWEADPSPRAYKRLVIYSMIPGVILQAAGVLVHALGSQTIGTTSLQFICNHLGSMGMTLGYMGIFVLLCRRPFWQKALRPLVAVGQMSLTNYISTSFLFGLIFYGYGLGLIGQVSPAVALVIALAVLAFLTVFSVCWLKYFQYGPLEWIWRVLTYLRWLPIRRPAR